MFTTKVIDDYDATSGAVRRWMKEADGKQPNDPRKLARAIVTLASTAEPPLRFTAGADAVQTFEETLAERRAELERWRALSESLAFEA